MWGWRWRRRICCCQVEWYCWGRMWRCCPSKLEWDWKPQCLPHLLLPLYKSVHLQIVPTQSAPAMLSLMTGLRKEREWPGDAFCTARRGGISVAEEPEPETHIVLESPVFWPRRIRPRLRPVQTFPKTKKTRPGPKKTETVVFFSLFPVFGLVLV